MRTPLLVSLLSLSLIGCVGIIDSNDPVGGDDDGSGSNPDPDPDPDPVPVPKLTSTIDKTTIATELGTTSTFKIELTGSGTFAGAVTVTPTAVDAANAPLTGWTVSVDSPTVTLATDGSATVTGTLVIPSQNKGLEGTVKFGISSSVGTESLDATVTATNQVTIVMNTDPGNGQCVYPSSGIAAALKINVGTKVRFMNMSPDTLTAHINGGATGFDHQPDPGSPTGTAYEQTASGLGNIEWYCHNTGPDLNGANPFVQVVAQ